MKILLLIFLAIAGFNQICDAELCISSVNYNSVSYRSINYSNIAPTITDERQTFSLKELRIITSKALGLSVSVIIDNGTTESTTFRYFATKNSMMSVLKPEAFDSVTFGVLSVTERTRPLSLTLATSRICTNEEDSITTIDQEDDMLLVLEYILSPFHFDSIKPFDSHQSMLSVVNSSSILLFLSTSVLSLLIVFEALPVCLKYFAKTKRGTKQNNKKMDPPHSWHLSSAGAGANEQAIVLGVYLVSICCTIAYIGYWIFNISEFILRDTSDYNSLERKSVSPFLVNSLFVTIMSITSVITALLIAIKQTRLSKQKCRTVFKIFVFVGFSCMAMLATCVIYHGFFLTIAIAVDYKTTLNQIIYYGTLLIAIYCSVPTILKLFYSSRKSRDRTNFIFSSSILFVAPVLYCMLISNIGSDNQPETADLSELTTTIVSSIIMLTIVVAIVILVFGKKSNSFATFSDKAAVVAANAQKPSNSPHKSSSNAQQQQLTETQDVIIKQRKPCRFSNRNLQHILFIMFSNPGRVITVVHDHKPSAIPQGISHV